MVGIIIITGSIPPISGFVNSFSSYANATNSEVAFTLTIFEISLGE